MEFHELMLRRMKQMNMTQSELARRTGVSQSNINLYCSGRRTRPQLATYRAIEKVLGDMSEAQVRQGKGAAPILDSADTAKFEVRLRKAEADLARMQRLFAAFAKAYRTYQAGQT